MDQTLRNKLRSVVTQCRKLLEESVSKELQGKFGIYAGGKKDAVQIEDEARLSHLSDADLAARRDILDHFEHIQARGFKAKDALDQLVREVAFTHLNRLCAYKMMEAREVYVGGQRFRDAVSRGVNSNGVKFYLADHPDDERLFNTGQQELAYRHFLDWLGGQLSEEIGVLFNPNDPANRLYPPQRVLDQVLDLLNEGDIKPDETELREAWPEIWTQDETIGWVYQYFTPKELRDQARKESAAPRNSYELAFRNQFFTPRYVVEFLTDNTLGCIWYEMRKAGTRLKDQCRYMVRRPSEVFLAEGQSPPEPTQNQEDLSQEELLKQPVHIPHRPKKDPRELRILDPACGSGHFLLYCFDLLLTIYEEAYADPDLGPKLKEDYPTLDALRWDVPRLILAHNVHGIDIDLRCTQIAALALWLRCQRAYREMGLKQDRPKISRSNIVCAEPMPGDKTLLDEFLKTLKQDRLEALIQRVMQVPEGGRVRATESMAESLTELVRLVWEKMQLAGEAGSLLKIQEELQEAVRKGQEEWEEKQPLFRITEFGLREEPKESYLRFVPGQGVSFWERAEALVLEALRDYARHASNGGRLERQLFAEDAERGFAFIDICRKRFDVVLMNPPFGQFSKRYKSYAKLSFPSSYNDILCAFTERWYWCLTVDGRLGAITSRTPFFISSASGWRNGFILQHRGFAVMADLGDGVMDDAMVEAAAYVLSRTQQQGPSVFYRMLGLADREEGLKQAIDAFKAGTASSRCFLFDTDCFRAIPDSPFAYWVNARLAARLCGLPSFEPSAGSIRVGLTTLDNFRFVRALWEVAPSRLGVDGDFSEQSQKMWAPLVIGGKSQPWYSPLQVCVKWKDNGKEIREYIRERGSESRWIRSPEFYFQPGFSWTRRAVRFIPYAIPAGCIPTASRYMAYPHPKKEVIAIGIGASNTASAFLRFYGEWFCRPNFLVESVKALPWPNLSASLVERLDTLVRHEVDQRRRAYQNHEPYHDFTAPSMIRSNAKGDAVTCDLSSFIGKELELEIASAFGMCPDEYTVLATDLLEAVVANSTMPQGHDDDEDEDVGVASGEEDVVLGETEIARRESLVSYCVGVAFGRWDVRLALDPGLIRKVAGPFDPLPVCCPGMLQGGDGLPANKPPEGYPLRIDWDGVLVDDNEHGDDIVGRVREVLELIWTDRAEAIEKEACEILGVKELRDYFRKPGKGGFWDDHVSRYSKSRRKAPIYWLLQSSRKNYALWLYYHRLDKDLLFKALANYVEPKIRLEESRLAALRGQKAGAAQPGKGAKKIDKDIETLEDLVSELRDFEDKLRRAANMHLEPDLNDGVVLNIAPLHELVPWKEAKKYWQELLEGKYEWSTIGKQLREKGVISC
ncbi:MAG: BREX-1 system adenine-specific DNA-methyltransferase PglX [Pirellulales bacterium]